MRDPPQRQRDERRIVDVRVVDVVELERPRRPDAGSGGARAQSPPGPVTWRSSSQSAALTSEGSSAGTPASRSARIASAVSQTGDWQASSQRVPLS